MLLGGAPSSLFYQYYFNKLKHNEKMWDLLANFEQTIYFDHVF